MKLSKFIFIGSMIYLTLFLIDFLITLFSIDETGVYRSKLGLGIDMTINDVEMFTTFSLTPQILVTYISWLFIICTVFFIIKKVKQAKYSH
ncbi:hypothetical protein HRF87_25815 [Bacillus sp. CRN 9]|nr:hypothetical protein [Bacillus sp. CRN 9]